MAKNLIQLQGGYKSFGERDLFEDVTVSVNLGEHIGVIGANGTGKTTFFKILLEQLELDKGQLIKSSQLKLGYLAQEDHWSEDQTIESFLTGLEKPVWELKTLGKNLGLSEEQFLQPVSQLSGGFRMRCKLLRLIGENPNLLLLDEPTNYLDLESLIVLEDFLKNYEGAFMLITHDHEFLNKVSKVTIGFENKKVDKLFGNVDYYFEQKKLQFDIKSRQKSNQDKKKKQLQDFVDRFGAKNTKAKQAKSKMKQIERMENIEVEDIFSGGVKMTLPPPVRSGKYVFEIDQLDLGYGDKTVLKEISLNILRGEHIAVVGYNGAGKSTFLKGISELVPPQKGNIKKGMNCLVSYFGQHVPENLDLSRTVMEEITSEISMDVDDQMVLDVAGALMFSGDALNKKVKVLSGGEKVRVALAKILLRKSSVLVLDEPTNHLDFFTVGALCSALDKYEGTVVFVSHDRKFVKALAQRVLIVNQGRIEVYHGSYEEYVWSLEKGILKDLKNQVAESLVDSNSSASISTQALANKVSYKRKKELEKRTKKIEKAMGRIDLEFNRINEQLSQDLPASERDQYIIDLQKNTEEKEAFESEWLEIQEELEGGE